MKLVIPKNWSYSIPEQFGNDILEEDPIKYVARKKNHVRKKQGRSGRRALFKRGCLQTGDSDDL